MALLRAARRHRSVALQAGGKHLMVDVWTSVGVVLGLLAAKASGWPWLDPLIALLMAAHIGREGLVLIRAAVDGLMDRALEPTLCADIERVLASFAHPTIRFDHLHTRRAGSRRYVDLHMHMPASWSLGRAAALRSSVEQALMSAVPGLRASIQLLPTDVEAHFDDQRDLI